MHRKIIFPAIVAMLAILTVSMLPVNAWVYPDSTSDAKWEQFGPRADKLLINLYADDLAEFAALEAGAIDIIDWPIPKAYYAKWTAPPYSDYIKVVNYGPEFGLFILDMNSNDNQYLGNPPNPTYVNPVADRDDAVGNPLIGGGAGPANNRNPMSNVWLRRAIGHLIDRPFMISQPQIGAGFGFPMYTTMPPGLAKYLLEVYGDPTMPWAWEYNPTAAAAMLDANGFPINGATGKRFWDRNGDLTEQADEYVELIFYIRSDHPGRKRIGEILVGEMDAIGLRNNPQYATSGTCFVKVMVQKNFHLYTGGWGLGVDPDHLILWSWYYYWHPGFCYNYGGHNDPEFNEAADAVMYANTQDEAVYWAYLAQYRQAYMVLGAPLYCVSGNKAYRRTYVGPETPYTGLPWQGIVNIAGYGIDNGATFANMHPAGYAYDHGDPANPMTIRYGFKVPEIKLLNPVYASWLFDWNVLDKIWSESLVGRNASDLGEFLPGLARNFELGTYMHPVYGESSKVRFTLRTDVSWSDGYALTVADVYFTYVELKNILSSRGLPPPWWWSNVQNILSFSILDPYTFEVLLDVKSYWALGWVGTNIILPKHIWKPIAETGDPQAFAPDPNMIGNGPWRFVDYVANSHVLLVANRPGRTVTTTLPGSSPVTAIDGYYANLPVNIDVHPLKPDGTDWWTEKIPAAGTTPPYTTAVKMKITIENLIRADELKVQPGPDLVIEKTVLVDDVPIFGPVTIPIPEWPGLHVEVFDLALPKCMHKITVIVNILAPSHDSWTFILKTITYTKYFWVTIKEDITGGTMHFYDGEPIHTISKAQIPTPDCKVDIKDVARAAKAFGSYPGHGRWDTPSDINGDYKIDIKDIATIAKKFGWA